MQLNLHQGINIGDIMNVVVAIDSFKGSLSSMDAGMAVSEGIKRAIPDAKVMVRPIADGGEGTVDALCMALGGIIMSIDVTGPLGEKVKEHFGDKAEPLYERLARYIKTLESYKFIRFM